MDLITDNLVTNKGNDSIFVVVDRLSTMYIKRQSASQSQR